jgi:hypothetical protein
MLHQYGQPLTLHQHFSKETPLCKRGPIQIQNYRHLNRAHKNEQDIQSTHIYIHIATQRSPPDTTSPNKTLKNLSKTETDASLWPNVHICRKAPAHTSSASQRLQTISSLLTHNKHVQLTTEVSIVIQSRHQPKTHSGASTRQIIISEIPTGNSTLIILCSLRHICKLLCILRCELIKLRQTAVHFLHIPFEIKRPRPIPQILKIKLARLRIRCYCQ